ncbi:PDR/VanB family oxidoreductase [Roseomonas sp. KE0001]|uniref:PDR/VanB family oxidoreductase n=1 Tax=Roseomonas sp. KE0001 TaxID=2479201 RepID=UPI0018DF9EE7|nr:PDR/VanB family oxidoreductase [Roseomonas sp. KE0001]MBI0436151.1 oxidoreductase [Roseomonas sp. KE0001]
MPRFITLVVARVLADGPGIRRLTLRDPDGWKLPKIRPGAHLDLQVPGLGARAYSLCGDPAAGDCWEVAVKLEAASRGGSAWVHGLAEGAIVEAAMPRCTFPLEPAATRHVMIAGGIGVTPFLAMAPVLQRLGVDWVLHVLHRGPAPCPAALMPWIEAGRAICHETGAAPRPDLAALLGPYTEGLQAYCCGPALMLDAFAEATRHWPAGRARIEHFTPPPLPFDPSARPYTIRLASSGAEAELAAGDNLLAALRKLGAKVDASCEGGICGACEVRWLEGEPVHRDRVLSPERRRTHLMACVAQCASDRLLVDL